MEVTLTNVTLQSRGEIENSGRAHRERPEDSVGRAEKGNKSAGTAFQGFSQARDPGETLLCHKKYQEYSIPFLPLFL